MVFKHQVFFFIDHSKTLLRSRENLGNWRVFEIFIHRMANRWHLIPSILVFLILAIKTASCFQCWECNSWYDWRCSDPFTEKTFSITNCTHRFPHAKEFVCRKLIQKIKGKTRTIRLCGHLGVTDQRKSCFKQAGTYDVFTEYCDCTHDSCNGSSMSFLSILLSIVTIANLFWTISWHCCGSGL